jgi:spore coat protein U-like protein
MMRAAIALIVLLALVRGADAQTCGATITSPIQFGGAGGPDVLSGAPVDTTATLTVTCSGLLGLMQVCVSIDAGTGGANGSTARFMQRQGGGGTASYQLYQDAARSQPWGSLASPQLGSVPPIGIVAVILGSTSATRTIYARLLGGQQTLPTGTYSSTLNTQIKYGALSALTGCDSPLLTKNSTGPTFQVQTTVNKNCLLSVAQDVNFGTRGALAAAVDAAGRLSVTCTSTTPLTISLGAGNGAGANANLANARKMTGPGGTTVTYGLFQDAARAVPWGDSLGVTTEAATGTGLATNVPVYGRVPAQTTPGPGTYSDTVVVTVTY